MNRTIIVVSSIAVYLVFISVLAIVLTISDKKASKTNSRRVPEFRLMLVGLLGGALPMYLCMKKIRHKTKHKKFMIGLPAEIILQILLIAAVCYISLL